MTADFEKTVQQFAQQYVDPLVDTLNDIGVCAHQDELNWSTIRIKFVNLQSLAHQWSHSEILYQLLGKIYALATDEAENDHVLDLSQRINQWTLIFTENTQQCLKTFDHAFKAARQASVQDVSQDAFAHVLQHQVLLTGIVEGLIDILAHNVANLLGAVIDAYVAVGIDIEQIKQAIKSDHVNFDFK